MGIISLSNALATAAAISVLAGNASIHTEKCVYQHQEIPEIAQYTWHDSEINLLIFSRICPSGLNGPFLGPAGREGWCGVGGVHCTDEACLNCSTDYIPFIPGVTMTSTNQLHRTSAL